VKDYHNAYILIIDDTNTTNIMINGKRRTTQDNEEYPDLHIKSRIKDQNNI
jgi:hypothetical protein